MVMGARASLSYGAKKYALKRAVERGEEFIYPRRYKTELKTRGSFCRRRGRNEFPEQEFEVRSGVSLLRNKGEDKDAWRKCGYFLALSTSGQHKSTPYPKVTTIISTSSSSRPAPSTTWKDEVKALLDFYPRWTGIRTGHGYHAVQRHLHHEPVLHQMGTSHRRW